jgi:hypothetical protein
MKEAGEGGPGKYGGVYVWSELPEIPDQVLEG